jgi:hypothetical protein
MVRLIKHKIITGLLLFIAIIIVGNTVNAEDVPTKITIKELFKYCNLNPMRADAIFNNAQLEVSGKIYKFDRLDLLSVNCLGNKLPWGSTHLYIMLLPETGNKEQVICVVPPSEEPKVISLNKGQNVTISGTYAGCEDNRVYLYNSKIK